MGAEGGPGNTCDVPGRPRVVVNCAMSADGKIALPERRSAEISSEEDLLRVHRLRASCDAILVGVGTVLADDPKLYVSPRRVPDPPSPLKVVLDAAGRTPSAAAFLHSPGRALVATVERAEPALRARIGAKADVRAFGSGGLVDLHLLLSHLARLTPHGVRTLLVEGGGTVIWSFFEAGLVDEYSVYVGPLVIGGATAPSPADGEGFEDMGGAVRLEMVSF
jgi:2,5-diamino-6-(ribosylamino)-4(3H)-pyrimidinone 5'-phosphate reductase